MTYSFEIKMFDPSFTPSQSHDTDHKQPNNNDAGELLSPMSTDTGASLLNECDKLVVVHHDELFRE